MAGHEFLCAAVTGWPKVILENIFERYHKIRWFVDKLA
jgi:hypothetical protein